MIGVISLALRTGSPELAPVEEETGWYFIDPEGELVIAGPFRKAWGFYCGLSAVEDESGCFHILIEQGL